MIGEHRFRRADVPAIRSERDHREQAERLREWAAEASRTGFTEYALELHMFAAIAERAAWAEREDPAAELME